MEGVGARKAGGNGWVGWIEEGQDMWSDGRREMIRREKGRSKKEGDAGESSLLTA